MLQISAHNSRLSSGQRYLLLSLALALFGLLLNIRKPIWLGPPYLTQTPLWYALLPLLAWLWALGQWLRASSLRPTAIALVMLILLLALCCLGLVLAPASGGSLAELIDLGLMGGSIGMQSFTCRDQPPLYQCEWRRASSDTPTVWLTHYHFRRLGPLLWLQQVDREIQLP